MSTPHFDLSISGERYAAPNPSSAVWFGAAGILATRDLAEDWDNGSQNQRGGRERHRKRMRVRTKYKVVFVF